MAIANVRWPSLVVARLFAHVHERAIPRELWQPSDGITIGDVGFASTDEITDNADVKRLRRRDQPQPVVRILLHFYGIVRMCVSRIPARGVQIPQNRDLEIVQTRVTGADLYVGDYRFVADAAYRFDLVPARRDRHLIGTARIEIASVPLWHSLDGVRRKICFIGSGVSDTNFGGDRLPCRAIAQRPSNDRGRLSVWALPAQDAQRQKQAA